MGEPNPITIDIREFALTSAIDTCAIWNLLSSPLLFRAASRKSRWFVVAGFVKYEALEKPRTRATAGELLMQEEFRRLLTEERSFREHAVSLSDLQAVAASTDTRRLGHGEIATLALARNLRCAVMTDDQAARRAAPIVEVGMAQTTPQLFGWLIYNGELTDSDVSKVIAEHEKHVETNRGRLTVYLNRVYAEACRWRLMGNGT